MKTPTPKKPLRAKPALPRASVSVAKVKSSTSAAKAKVPVTAAKARGSVSKVARPAAKARAPVTAAKDEYVLRLFVAGATARSNQAILRVRGLCETTLSGRVKLEVIDIYQQPGLAQKHQIVATPTLIILLPLPVRRFIGSLTNIGDLLGLLDLGEKGRIVL